MSAGAGRWLLWRDARRRSWAMTPLAAAVALGSAAIFAALGTAHRTSEAYPRYLERAAVGDLLINPGIVTKDIDRVLRSLPGVRMVTTDNFFLAELEGGSSADEYFGQVRGSTNGRYTDMDRPVLVAGRLPTGGAEALVNTELARRRHLRVGDELTVDFARASDDIQTGAAVTPTIVGVEKLTVVGIGTLADEVLPDATFPRLRIIVSPDIAARYTCGTPAAPPAGASSEDFVAALLPPTCATTQQFYSLDLANGDADVPAAEAAFVAQAATLNAELPALPGSTGSGRYTLFATTTAQERTRVERATQPTTSALTVLGLLAALTTIALAAVAITRELRRRDDDVRRWWELGMTAGGRAATTAAPIVVATTLGTVVGVFGAWLLSPLGPVGAVRSVARAPGRTTPSLVWLAAATLALGLAAMTAGLAVRAARRAGRVEERATGSGRRWRVLRSTSPTFDEGLRGAFGGPRPVLTVVGTAIAAIALVATLVFGSSFAALLSRADDYGWPWDVAVIVNAGYGGLDLPSARAGLSDRPDVAQWSALGFSSGDTLAGESLAAVIDFGGTSSVPVVRGRLPDAPGEVAVGARTADELHLAVGDQVELAGDDVDRRQVVVTGVVVLPALGAFLVNHASPGFGMLLPGAALQPDMQEELPAFIGVSLVPGVHRGDALASLRSDVASWQHSSDAPVAYDAPVRPPEIVNAQALRSVPLLVGALLAVATAIGFGIALVVTTRGRRREIGTLRALGFTSGQLRRVVAVQAMATMAAALIVATPVGTVLGRAAWRAFATRLGVLAQPSTPVIAFVIALLSAMVVAWVVSLPSQRAANRRFAPTRD